MDDPSSRSALPSHARPHSMQTTPVLGVVLPLLTSSQATAPTPSQAAAAEAGISVYFSPNGHCTEAVVEQINKAKRSVRVLAYRLTSKQIDAALIAARAR